MKWLRQGEGQEEKGERGYDADGRVQGSTVEEEAEENGHGGRREELSMVVLVSFTDSRVDVSNHRPRFPCAIGGTTISELLNKNC